MKNTFTKAEVIDLLVNLQVANGNKQVFENTVGRNFGERAEKIVDTYVELKNSSKSALSFASMLKK